MAQTITLPPLVRGKWIPMTSEEFDAWVSDVARAEWVDGEGIIHVTRSVRHVRSDGFLYTLLKLFLNLNGIGEVFDAPFEMRLRDGRSRREPDVLVVLNEHRDRIRRHWLEGAADFAAEFISRYSVQDDLVRKRLEYEMAGVRELLIIDTREGEVTFIFLRLDADGRYQDVEPDAEGRYHSQVLPGFWLKAEWFRMDPLPRAEHLMLEIAPDAYLQDLLAADQAWRAGHTGSR